MRPLLLSLCLLFPTLLCAQTTLPLAETPRPADALVDSMGVNIHMTFSDTAYHNVPAVKTMLSQLGIRHVRDGATYYPNDANFGEQEYSAYGQLSALGIGFDLIVDYDRGTDPNPMTPAVVSSLQSLAANHAVTVDSYEGPNETDIQGNSNWLLDTRAFMKSLFASVSGTSGAKSVPVLGNSLAGPGSNWALLGNMTAYEDAGNLHPYANTQYPSYFFPQDFAAQLLVSGAQPIYVTEAGWANAMSATDNSPNVSEDVAGRYLGRLFFETLLRGCPRTYVYELVDEKPDPSMSHVQQHFGLFRNDYSPKPAASMISNLVKLMSDKGPAYAAQPLSYSLAVPSPSVHHMLFQKRDRSYWLALWQEVSDWKGWNAQGTPVSNPDVAVTLTLPASAASIQVFNPRASTSAITSFSGQQKISVMVPDSPVLVRVSFVSPPSGLTATVDR